MALQESRVVDVLQGPETECNGEEVEESVIASENYCDHQEHDGIHCQLSLRLKQSKKLKLQSCLGIETKVSAKLPRRVFEIRVSTRVANYFKSKSNPRPGSPLLGKFLPFFQICQVLTTTSITYTDASLFFPWTMDHDGTLLQQNSLIYICFRKKIEI